MYFSVHCLTRQEIVAYEKRKKEEKEQKELAAAKEKEKAMTLLLKVCPHSLLNAQSSGES